MPFWLLIYLIFPYIPIVCSNIRVCCLWRPRRPPAPSCPCSPPVGPSTPSSGCLQKSPALVSVRADGPWRPCKLTKPLHTCSICIFIFTWRKFHECHLHMPLESYVDQWWCYFRGIKWGDVNPWSRSYIQPLWSQFFMCSRSFSLHGMGKPLDAAEQDIQISTSLNHWKIPNPQCANKSHVPLNKCWNHSSVSSVSKLSKRGC